MLEAVTAMSVLLKKFDFKLACAPGDVEMITGRHHSHQGGLARQNFAKMMRRFIGSIRLDCCVVCNNTTQEGKEERFPGNYNLSGPTLRPEANNDTITWHNKCTDGFRTR
jgi:hypothetical protein